MLKNSLFFLFILFCKEEWQIHNPVYDKNHQKILPAVNAATKICTARQYGNHVVIDVMKHYCSPDIPGSAVGKAKEYRIADTGNDLDQDALQPRIRTVIKQIDRQMP